MEWREESVCVYHGDDDDEEEEDEDEEEDDDDNEKEDIDRQRAAAAPAARASPYSSYRANCQLQIKRREEPRSSAVLIQSTFRVQGSKRAVQRRKQAVAVIQSSMRGRASRKAAADERSRRGGGRSQPTPPALLHADRRPRCLRALLGHFSAWRLFRARGPTLCIQQLRRPLRWRRGGGTRAMQVVVAQSSCGGCHIAVRSPLAAVAGAGAVAVSPWHGEGAHSSQSSLTCCPT